MGYINSGYLWLGCVILWWGVGGIWLGGVVLWCGFVVGRGVGLWIGGVVLLWRVEWVGASTALNRLNNDRKIFLSEVTNWITVMPRSGPEQSLTLVGYSSVLPKSL